MDGIVEAVLEDVAVAGSGEFFILLLKTRTGDYVPMTIGSLEAMSILAGRSREPRARPLSHDLLLTALELLGASLARVEISELVMTSDGGTFFAKVILENRGVELELDARPSDAIALAVRVGATIWIAESVVRQVGMSDFGEGAEA